MPEKKASVVVHGSKSARFRPEIPKSLLVIHPVSDDFERLKVTIQLPSGRFGGNEVLSLVKCAFSNAGVAILIQRPDNPSLQPEDWREPVLSQGWKVVGGKLINLDWCLKTNQCDSISSLLQTHFRNFWLDDLGWEKKEANGKYAGLRIFRTKTRS